MNVTTRQALVAVYEYSRSRDWTGYDPYDGLKSRIFNATPLKIRRVTPMNYKRRATPPTPTMRRKSSAC